MPLVCSDEDSQCSRGRTKLFIYRKPNTRETKYTRKQIHEIEENEMTKGPRLTVAAAILAVAMLIGPSCFAQTIPLLGAGSSAAFNAFALAGTAGAGPLGHRRA